MSSTHQWKRNWLTLRVDWCSVRQSALIYAALLPFVVARRLVLLRILMFRMLAQVPMWLIRPHFAVPVSVSTALVGAIIKWLIDLQLYLSAQRLRLRPPLQQPPLQLPPLQLPPLQLPPLQQPPPIPARKVVCLSFRFMFIVQAVWHRMLAPM